jgi:hypothetical protein
MKITPNGHIALTYGEFEKTRMITADMLNCGHMIIPVNPVIRSHEKIVCPACGKKTFHTGACTNHTDMEAFLKAK